MAVKKKPKAKGCLAGHDDHPLCNLHCCAITPERGAEIRAMARSGTNWASVSPVRPTYGGKKS